MENNFNQFIKQLSSVRLNRVEKRAGWEFLVKELALKPAPVWGWTIAYALGSLVLTMALGAGLTQAAEGAVPGDILYPLKTRVSEPVERLLVSKNPAGQVAFETQLVERRLNEAKQVLIKKETEPKKDHQKTEQIKDDLKIRIAEQTARVMAVEKEENKLKAVFDKHQDVIDKLNSRQDQDDVRKLDDKRQHKSKSRKDD